ncbi:Luciferase-like monooxygenase [Asanoa hainanensis]|uniref:Luciferase-like monooxygenase n=1 Tax=Asanoa hainanensis TaxID=560556 RepID=A0A239PC48_9ACTN|nr:LLM class flavin-dependent oxidoreductase [Asanoa hainanensis]SNT64523.1 Luciferase-like monooxygenase [Asanoa hainanensis]
MDLKYAVGLPTVGAFGDVRTLTDLAVSAERHGWHGVQLWDHLLADEPGWPVASSTVAAAAIAARTSRIRIILTVVLPRRQVQEVAQDTAAIHALSAGRLTVLATIGAVDREYTELGLDPDLRTRGKALDDRLDTLRGLWGADDIPIWCGGRWPRRVGLRRAARFDGVLATFEGHHTRNSPVSEVAEATAFVRGLAGDRFDVAVEGASEAASAREHILPYANAGLTWWVEALGWWRADSAARITEGPPT